MFVGVLMETKCSAILVIRPSLPRQRCCGKGLSVGFA
jgi:hypothetical protein